MKRLFCAASIVILAVAAGAEDFTVRVHETQTIEIPGATAAYAIDPAIADATVTRPGVVTVTGRTAGTTQFIAVTPVGTKDYLIVVGAPRNVVVPSAVTTGAPIARVESRYSTGSQQVQNAFDVFTTDADRRSQFHALNVHYLRDTFGRSTNVFPSIFYRVTSPGRDLVLLDDLVDLSPLTIRSTQLRGVHLREGPWELHGGYAASSLYEDLFLPADRRWVAGASYSSVDALGLRWIPSMYAFFSSPRNTGAHRGVVGSFAVEKQRGENLFARGEVAFSRSPAASTEVRYESRDTTFRARAWYKPDDFPTLALSDLQGTHAAVDWSGRLTQRMTFDSYATFDRMNLAGFAQSLAVSNIALRYQATRHFTILGGLESSALHRPSLQLDTIGIPVGVSYDAESFGASASYRVLHTSNVGRRGDTLRLSARGSVGPLRINAWAERQRQAPTLDLIFREEPGLELALLRLGITVRSPEDLARVLRDDAALINLGFIEGVNVDLAPRRRQAGFDVALLTPGARDQLHLHAVYDRVEGIRGGTADSALATLTYSRRVFLATDLYAAVTVWRSLKNQTAYEFGVRQRFDGVPHFLQRSGTIEGVVTEGTTPVAGVVIMLDNTQAAHTDRNGHYAFNAVKPGEHRLTATLTGSTPAFFTTPSQVNVAQVPARVDFGILRTPARIAGRVLSDASLGIPGVVISVTASHGKSFTATTDTEGEFDIATPPGHYTVTLAAESLPSGYTISGESSRTTDAVPDRPQHVMFEVHALRSIAGTAPGAKEVHIEQLGRTATTDAAGNFVFRSMPAGTFTLSARDNQRVTVTLPAEPTRLENVVLGTAVAPLPPVIQRRAFVVQVGAFREPSNAQQLIQRIARFGRRAWTAVNGGLTFVRVGPFPSLNAAIATSRQLRRAGFETLITNR